MGTGTTAVKPASNVPFHSPLNGVVKLPSNVHDTKSLTCGMCGQSVPSLDCADQNPPKRVSDEDRHLWEKTEGGPESKPDILDVLLEHGGLAEASRSYDESDDESTSDDEEPTESPYDMARIEYEMADFIRLARACSAIITSLRDVDLDLENENDDPYPDSGDDAPPAMCCNTCGALLDGDTPTCDCVNMK